MIQRAEMINHQFYFWDCEIIFFPGNKMKYLITMRNRFFPTAEDFFLCCELIKHERWFNWCMNSGAKFENNF